MADKDKTEARASIEASTVMYVEKSAYDSMAARVQKLEAALFRAQGGLIDIKHMGPSPQSKWAEQRLTEIDQILKGEGE